MNCLSFFWEEIGIHKTNLMTSTLWFQRLSIFHMWLIKVLRELPSLCFVTLLLHDDKWQSWGLNSDNWLPEPIFLMACLHCPSSQAYWMSFIVSRELWFFLSLGFMTCSCLCLKLSLSTLLAWKTTLYYLSYFIFEVSLRETMRFPKKILSLPLTCNLFVVL